MLVLEILHKGDLLKTPATPSGDIVVIYIVGVDATPRGDVRHNKGRMKKSLLAIKCLKYGYCSHCLTSERTDNKLRRALKPY